MKIAICEDNKQDLQLFEDLCNAYRHKTGKSITVEPFCSGEALLKEFTPQKYDAIFLDIYMKDLTGIATATEIRKTDETVKLIFTTTSTEHYGEGFAVEATHYLIKPLTEEKLAQAMHRLRNLCAQTETLLVLANGAKSVQIPQRSILYIETIRNGIEIHCEHEVIAVRVPLSTAVNQLTDSCFLQCNRYSAVNLKHVVSICDDAFIMQDGKQVLLRKANQKELEQAYHQYRVAQLRGEFT